MATAKTKGRKKVTLECVAKPKCEVYVAGTFNGWDPKRKRMKPVDGDGRYRTTLMVPPGRHEYKFVVGKQWRIDENNDVWTPNDFGSLNSVLKVG